MIKLPPLVTSPVLALARSVVQPLGQAEPTATAAAALKDPLTACDSVRVPVATVSPKLTGSPFVPRHPKRWDTQRRCGQLISGNGRAR